MMCQPDAKGSIKKKEIHIQAVAVPIYKMLDLLAKFHGFSMTFCPYFKIP